MQDFCREVIIWKRLSHPNILPLFGATMDGGKYRMVSPWVGDKNIVEFLRENLETNPLKLARLVFHFARGIADFGRS